MNIAILLTVHNRREKTLQCLKNIYDQQFIRDIIVDVFLTDDNCTDGTKEAVLEMYPNVHVINGDGTLFWNRGMYKAWEYASKLKKYDYFLWINDDSYILANCVSSLIADSERCENKAIIVGSMKSSTGDKTTYGGKILNNNLLVEPNGSLQECDTMNGNCVLIPRYVFDKCGNLDWTYRHAIGDLDYGLRAKKKGIKIYVAKTWAGICDKNPRVAKWARADVPFFDRLKNLYSPLGYAEPIPFFKYECKHFGLVVAIKHFVSAHIRVILPKLWEKH